MGFPLSVPEDPSLEKSESLAHACAGQVACGSLHNAADPGGGCELCPRRWPRLLARLVPAWFPVFALVPQQQLVPKRSSFEGSHVAAAASVFFAAAAMAAMAVMAAMAAAAPH